MQYTTYTTMQGERWDSVMLKAYGDALLPLDDVIAANPGIPVDVTFVGGEILNIPVIDGSETSTIKPPWETL